MRLDARTYSSLPHARDSFLQAVDVWASEARTVDPALSIIYQAKLAEAKVGGGPLLSREAFETGSSLAVLCEQVQAANTTQMDAWSEIEARRIRAKTLIRGASSVAEMSRTLTRLRESNDG